MMLLIIWSILFLHRAAVFTPLILDEVMDLVFISTISASKLIFADSRISYHNTISFPINYIFWIISVMIVSREGYASVILLRFACFLFVCSSFCGAWRGIILYINTWWSVDDQKRHKWLSMQHSRTCFSKVFIFLSFFHLD